MSVDSSLGRLGVSASSLCSFYTLYLQQMMLSIIVNSVVSQSKYLSMLKNTLRSSHNLPVLRYVPCLFGLSIFLMPVVLQIVTTCLSLMIFSSVVSSPDYNFRHCSGSVTSRNVL